jgi:murein DD-endopeptidase MepM/ murein hydrolase activator NlpD
VTRTRARRGSSRSDERRWWPGWHTLIAVLVGAFVALLPIGPPAAAADRLVPPLPPPLKVLHAFVAAPAPWAAGNRGVDLVATAGEPVFAGAAGVVVYAGALAGRGVVSIDDGADHLTYEPLEPVVATGSTVTAGQLIGQVAAEVDNCGPPGSCLHFGVRDGVAYADPMSLLGTPAVRLLPIWDGAAPGTSDAAEQSHTPDAASAPAAAAPPIERAPARFRGGLAVGAAGTATTAGLLGWRGLLGRRGLLRVRGRLTPRRRVRRRRLGGLLSQFRP